MVKRTLKTLTSLLKKRSPRRKRSRSLLKRKNPKKRRKNLKRSLKKRNLKRSPKKKRRNLKKSLKKKRRKSPRPNRKKKRRTSPKRKMRKTSLKKKTRKSLRNRTNLRSVKTKVMVKIASLLKVTTARIVNASRKSLLDPAAKRSLTTTRRIPITRNAMPNKLSVNSKRVNRPMANRSLPRASKKSSLRRRRKKSLRRRKKKNLRRKKKKNLRRRSQKRRKKRNLRLNKKKKRKNPKPSKKRKKRSLRRKKKKNLRRKSPKKRRKKSLPRKKTIRRKMTSPKRKKRAMIRVRTRVKRKRTRAKSKSLRNARTKVRARSVSLKKVTTKRVVQRSRRSLLAQPTTPQLVKDPPKTQAVSMKEMLSRLMKRTTLSGIVLTCLLILATNSPREPCTTSSFSRIWMETGPPRDLIPRSQQPSSSTCAITHLRTSVVPAKMTRSPSELMKLATARCSPLIHPRLKSPTRSLVKTLAMALNSVVFVFSELVVTCAHLMTLVYFPSLLTFGATPTRPGTPKESSPCKMPQMMMTILAMCTSHLNTLLAALSLISRPF